MAGLDWESAPLASAAPEPCPGCGGWSGGTCSCMLRAGMRSVTSSADAGLGSWPGGGAVCCEGDASACGASWEAEASCSGWLCFKPRARRALEKLRGSEPGMVSQGATGDLRRPQSAWSSESGCPRRAVGKSDGCRESHA